MSADPGMNLAAFLLARIAEDEAGARTATPGPWRVEMHSSTYHDSPGWRSTRWSVEAGENTPVDVELGRDYNLPEGGCEHQPDAQHIARWDPARVLTECEAKRRIVMSAQTSEAMLESPPFPGGRWGSVHHGVAQGLTKALRFIALPYADHPDYRQEWAP